MLLISETIVTYYTTTYFNRLGYWSLIYFKSAKNLWFS